jgi:AcrR family transcriptional regulator
MGRPKLFSREAVLNDAMALFWQKGFADTSLQDIEHATGVNKSGLYTEFKNKEDIFLQSLRHYYADRASTEILSAKPQGWDNIQRFLAVGQTCYNGQRGCFSINSLRDISQLPPEARAIVDGYNAQYKRLIIANIKAERPGIANAPLLADMTMTFFSGLCIEENTDPRPSAVSRKIASFMDFLRQSK